MITPKSHNLAGATVWSLDLQAAATVSWRVTMPFVDNRSAVVVGLSSTGNPAKLAYAFLAGTKANGAKYRFFEVSVNRISAFTSQSCTSRYIDVAATSATLLSLRHAQTLTVAVVERSMELFVGGVLIMKAQLE